MKEMYDFNNLLDIVATLRGEEGCPWDRAQTHESLKQYLIEEAYEVCEAIDLDARKEDTENLPEELGDVLFQVVLHSQIAKEEGKFSIDEVVDGISKKMIRRHPHVFNKNGNHTIDEETINAQWDQIKKQEKNMESLEEALKSIPKAFPATFRAEKAQKQGAKIGLSPQTAKECLKQMKDEIQKIEVAVENSQEDSVQGDFETLLFDTVNLARFLQLNAENSLTNATNKFINRLIDVEHLAMANGAHLCDVSIEELRALWEQVNNQDDYIKRRMNTLEEE